MECRRGRSRQLLALGAAVFAFCPEVSRAQPLTSSTSGLHAEYFLPLPEEKSCDPVNGSFTALGGLVPNISRRDQMISFNGRLSFKINRCGWERNLKNYISYDCRGTDRLLDYFAARYTGYIEVRKPGNYLFEMEADDGARLFIGNNRCPGVLCGSWKDTMNMHSGMVVRTNYDDDSRGKWCELCQNSPGGMKGDCWVTAGGCEPYALWMLDNDNGDRKSREFFKDCKRGGNISKTSSTRYLGVGLFPFRAEYFNRGGEATFNLRWKGPDSGDKLEPVPPTSFRYPDHRGLNAEFFEVPKNTVRLAPKSSHGDPPAGSKYLHTEVQNMKDTKAAKNAFALNILKIDKPVYIRWSGYFKIKRAGEYRFIVEADDGTRLTIGGKGVTQEQHVVDEPGLRNTFLPSKKGSAILTAGLHPMRLELFYIPPANAKSAFASISYPGVRITYSGIDTGATEAVEKWVDLAQSTAIFQARDGSCSLRNFDLGGGLSMNRDCAGTCFDKQEASVGDWVCEDGSQLGMLNLMCPTWQQDADDCEIRLPGIKTTPRPLFNCFISAPGGNFKQHSREMCEGSASPALYEGYCEEREKVGEEECTPAEDDPDSCVYSRCCVARMYDTFHWGTQCLAYGAPQGKTCDDTLQEIVYKEKFRTNLLIESSHVPQWQRPLTTPGPQVRGEVIKECQGNLCNKYPTTMIINPITLNPTNTPECPAKESERKGLQCWEGPWDVTGLEDPYNNCQDGKYEWNFCKNRKTVDGMPFVRCCSFAYTNPYGKTECLFRGLPAGPKSCARYLEEFFLKSARSQFTKISNALLLRDCTRNRCNHPKDPEEGCPDAVDEFPKQTDADRPDGGGVQSLEEMLKEAGEQTQDTLPWGIIGVGIAGFFLLILILYLMSKMFKEPEVPIFHSAKAKVIADDTFVEPDDDKMLSGPGLPSSKYGIVKPRHFGLKEMIEDTKFRTPKVIRDRRAAEEAQAIADEAERNRILALKAAEEASSSEETEEEVQGSDGVVRKIRRKRSKIAAPKPPKLPGQLVDYYSDEEVRPSPVATAVSLSLALTDAGQTDAAAAGQAKTFNPVDAPFGRYGMAMMTGAPILESDGSWDYIAQRPPPPAAVRCAASARLARQGRQGVNVAL